MPSDNCVTRVWTMASLARTEAGAVALAAELGRRILVRVVPGWFCSTTLSAQFTRRL